MASNNKYSVTEPHPTASTYLRSGRGGAGNTFRAPPTSDGPSARGPASLIALPGRRFFASGRGGAGNISHPATAAAAADAANAASQACLSPLDEELLRQSSRDRRMQTEAYHVGRGGAGNLANVLRKDSSSSVDTVSSTGSARSGFLARLNSHLERR